MLVAATAGHVDHGKSTLVLALSGTDPDRWAEEKRRGLTIDLGFAHVRLPSGRELALVDVPGHVRFIRNALAGVGAVDAALLVVAANEGWMPQSEEHLRILELLGVRPAVVAITKVAGVDVRQRARARGDVEERLAASELCPVGVVEVDAPAGLGITALVAALERLASAAPAVPDRGRARLWIDRSFAARGAGTVVTGTLAGGALAIGDDLEVVGPGRAGRRRVRGRVRGLQTHGRSQPSVGPGARVAVNLAGVGHRDLERGDALVHPGRWHVTRTVDASLRVLDSLGHGVSRRGAFQLYVGSGEHAVRLRILGADAIPAGGRGHARLHLPVGLPLVPGDRFVVRESGRDETVGGGEILDVDPVLPASRARPSRSVARVLAERGWVETAELSRLTGQPCQADLDGRWSVDPAALDTARRRLLADVRTAGADGLDVAVLDERQRAVLVELASGNADVRIVDGRAVAAGAERATPEQVAWLADLRDRPWAARLPADAGVGRDGLRRLVRSGQVVEREGVWFAAETVEWAAGIIERLLAANPEGVTVAQVRDALGATRRHVLPLLGHLDASGVTRRRGDRRVAGPRLRRVGP